MKTLKKWIVGFTFIGFVVFASIGFVALSVLAFYPLFQDHSYHFKELSPLYLLILGIIYLAILILGFLYLLTFLKQNHELVKLENERVWQFIRDGESRRRYDSELPLRNALDIYSKSSEFIKPFLQKEMDITPELIQRFTELLEEQTNLILRIRNAQ